MKGIILAGGSGTRLLPLTKCVSKQLLPIHDKPMIFYPLSTLMLAGVKDVMVITTPIDSDSFRRLLGNGNQLGIRISYATQELPRGIAEALLIAEDFIGTDTVALILGDNIFHGHDLPRHLKAGAAAVTGGLFRAVLFLHHVKDPGRYGVASVDRDGQITDIEEKPKSPKSNLAVTGLYLYDNSAVQLAGRVTPSRRGELEITDLNLMYVKTRSAMAITLPRGMAWLDTGTHDSIAEASSYIRAIEKRQGLKVCCPEEVAFRAGFIDREGLLRLSSEYPPGIEYGDYLKEISRGDMVC